MLKYVEIFTEKLEIMRNIQIGREIPNYSVCHCYSIKDNNSKAIVILHCGIPLDSLTESYPMIKKLPCGFFTIMF